MCEQHREMCQKHRPRDADSLPELHLPAGAACCAGDGPKLGRRGFTFMLVGASGAALVGCVGPGDTGLGLRLVSAEQVDQMGVETWQRIRAETPTSNNRTYNQALQRVGGQLVAAAGDSPRNWEMVVFAGDEANAFALPGNKIGVYEGMFRYADDDALLATIVGHEIGHNRAEHAAERVSSAAATQLGVQLVSAALAVGNFGYANEIAGLLGAGVQYGVILPYSRNQELEADEIGLFDMARAGYDPRASVALWQRLAGAGARPAEFLSTHPAPEARIGRLEQLMPRALDVYRSA